MIDTTKRQNQRSRNESAASSNSKLCYLVKGRCLHGKGPLQI